MSDDRKGPLEGLGDLDWDSALDEWEKSSFVAEPETSKAKATPEPAAATPAPAPIEPPAPAPSAEGTAPFPSSPPIPPAFAVEETAPFPAVEVPTNTSGSIIPRPNPLAGQAGPTGTVIVPVPRELQNEPRIEAPPTDSSSSVVPPARPSSPASRGGLDQLFSRPPKGTTSRPSLPAITAPVARDVESVTRMQAAIPLEQRESEHTRVRSEAPPHEPPPLSRPPLPPPSLPPVSTPPHHAAPPAAAEDLAPDDETAEWPAVRPAAGQSISTSTIASSLQDSLEDSGEHETVVFDRKSIPDSAERSSASERVPADDEMPTIGRASKAPLASADAHDEPPPSAPTSFEGEKPGESWLDAKKASSFAIRVGWLEEEARAVADDLARGRALLAVSELCAISGDRDRALALATEARDVAPQIALAWRQARQLVPREPDSLVEALDAEAGRSPTPSARAHATLLAADVLRLNSLGDAAVERWDSACKLDPADTRGPIARAALALAQNDHTSGTLRLAENSELISFDKAVATALRLRGVERPGAEFDDMPINDGLRHARVALEAGDVVAAAQSAGEIAALPELAKGALWLSASLGATHIASRRAAARALKTLASDGEELARRQLAARGIELDDPELVTVALGPEESAATDTAFDPSERSTLRVLATPKGGHANVDPASIEFLGGDRPLLPLEDALSAMSPILAADGNDADTMTRARRVAGNRDSRALGALGRLLATGVTDSAIDEALRDVAEPRPPSAGGVALENAVRTKRWAELSATLSSLPDGGASDMQRHIAAAIIAERAEDRDLARKAWRASVRGTATHDGVLRIAASLDREVDLGEELLRLGESMTDGVASAVLRLEGLTRSTLTDDEQMTIFGEIHRAAPALGIGGFLAERVARRKGDVDEVLRWIQERRSYATDALETALDAVREALLIADRDPELASTRLEEAHRARPDDVALRELHERLASEPPADRGAWREKRATMQTGITSSLLWIEAALEHDRAGDRQAALQAARRAAESGDRGLSGPLIERSELELGLTARQTDLLDELSKSTDEIERREALERLAAIEAFSKKDLEAASQRHRAILESSPRHKPSLRWLEHVLIGQGRDEGLAPILEQIALALDGTAGGESTAHAQHAARLHARDAGTTAADAPNAWERTHDMARLAATQPEASLWALRALNAHARVLKDDEALLKTTLELLDRTQRTPERASLLLRASEAASRLGRGADAQAYLEQAASEDPGDVVTWGVLAETHERNGDARKAAEACESLARTSVVPEHQLLAWHDASKIWLTEVKDTERAMTALEAAAEIDSTHGDIFNLLSRLYAEKNLDAELARLLEKRLATALDDEERVSLEVELARAFVEMGEVAKAKGALQSALTTRPDHTTALAAMADLCAKDGDWAGAEQAYVRLARLLSDPEEQRSIYERLGELYSVHAPNLARAEVAFKEVLKRSPDNPIILERLVDVYKRQGDVPRAVESQQAIVSLSTDPDVRLACLIDLAKIHENVGRDPRRSEQVLDSARKEFPTSVVALRAMAEFYSRQRQMPAMQILLDRAAGDARRSFAQGRFVPALFQVLHAAFELRGKRDAARVVAATLAAVEGQDSDLSGADARAVDPRLDEGLAPDIMSPALRALLARVGDTLDAVAPVDLRSLKATPLQPGSSIGATVGSVATMIGLGALQILVSPQLGRVAIPLASNPPTLLIGEGLAKVKSERSRVFVVVRALKMILAHASAMVRTSPPDVAPLIAGLFNAFNPSYIPQGVNEKRVAEYARRIGPALPRNLDPTIGVIALEAAGMLGTQWAMLGPAAAAWANRVALLAVGDPNAALDAIAWDKGEEKAPTGSEERAAWIARHVEARELMTFSVTDAYADARMKLGLEK